VRYMFQVKDRTRRAAHDMIMTMAQHGNHDYTFTSDADVKRFFAAGGYDYDELVRASRKWNSAVPLVENVVPGTWTVTAGATVAVIDSRTGQEITKVEGPRTYTPYHYWARFEDAVRDFRQFLEGASVGAFGGSVSSGLASMEAYLAHRAWIHNSEHPHDQLADSEDHPLRFDDKIDQWIPRMCGGRRLHKGGRNWADSRALRAFRNEVVIHPKGSAISMPHRELCRLANMFRSGIAGLLMDLHLQFGERIPCVIVRYAYLGDIELVSQPD
jgi:hypothetical protein